MLAVTVENPAVTLSFGVGGLILGIVVGILIGILTARRGRRLRFGWHLTLETDEGKAGAGEPEAERCPDA